jgi:hypothetical protein
LGLVDECSYQCVNAPDRNAYYVRPLENFSSDLGELRMGDSKGCDVFVASSIVTRLNHKVLCNYEQELIRQT